MKKNLTIKLTMAALASGGLWTLAAHAGGIALYEIATPDVGLASAYRDFLAAGKIGIEHAGFYFKPQEYDEVVAQALVSGAKMQETAQSMGNKFAYLFLAKPIRSPMDQIQLGEVSPQKAEAIRKSVAGGIEVGEVIPLGTQFGEMFAKVKEDAATWDGKTKPVCHLLNPAEEAGFDVIQLGERVERWFKEK